MLKKKFRVGESLPLEQINTVITRTIGRIYFSNN